MRDTQKRNLKCILTEAEILHHGRENARYQQELTQVELQAKDAAAEFKSKIENLKSNISSEARLVNNGYEYRMVECRIQLNTPEKGKKTYVRLDTGEQVGTDDMEPGDEQISLIGEAVDDDPNG